MHAGELLLYRIAHRGIEMSYSSCTAVYEYYSDAVVRNGCNYRIAYITGTSKRGQKHVITGIPSGRRRRRKIKQKRAAGNDVNASRPVRNVSALPPFQSTPKQSHLASSRSRNNAPRGDERPPPSHVDRQSDHSRCGGKSEMQQKGETVLAAATCQKRAYSGINTARCVPAINAPDATISMTFSSLRPPKCRDGGLCCVASIRH